MRDITFQVHQSVDGIVLARLCTYLFNGSVYTADQLDALAAAFSSMAGEVRSMQLSGWLSDLPDGFVGDPFIFDLIPQ